MGHRDHLFFVDFPRQASTGWSWTVRGVVLRCRGPLPTHALAVADQEAVFRRWNQAARRRGGWVWRQTARRWVVTMPEAVAVAGLPFEHQRCNRG